MALFLLASSSAVHAHEVRPAIADLTVTGDRLDLSVTLNAEALIAGVNLDGVMDTDETEASDTVDELRRLEPDALKERVAPVIGPFAASLQMTAGGAVIALDPVKIEVGPVDDPALPRDTVISLQGRVPSGTGSISMTWPAEYGDLVLRQHGVEDPYTGYLSGGQSSGPIAIGGGDAQSAPWVFVSYVPIGFDHILPKGLDHILFVLGLFFLSTHLSPLLWQVTAFTVAHTVTLAMAALGIVTVPASIVEPLIAASIVYVAVENVLSDKLHAWRPLVVFCFGLLHGLGFASVLGDVGLPEGQVFPALIGFNVGVELGQLTVIAAAFLLVRLAEKVDEGDTDPRVGQGVYLRLFLVFAVFGYFLDTEGFRAITGAPAELFFWPAAALCLLCVLSARFVDQLDAYRRFVSVPASVAIALVGAYWFVERVMA